PTDAEAGAALSAREPLRRTTTSGVRGGSRPSRTLPEDVPGADPGLDATGLDASRLDGLSNDDASLLDAADGEACASITARGTGMIFGPLRAPSAGASTALREGIRGGRGSDLARSWVRAALGRRATFSFTTR